MLCVLYCFALFLDQIFCIEQVWHNPLSSLNLPAQCGIAGTVAGLCPPWEKQHRSILRRQQRRLRASTGPQNCKSVPLKILPVLAGLKTLLVGSWHPALSLHVSLSRWKVENRGWTFLPSVPPCYLLAFLSWCVDVTLAVMFLMCCTRSRVDGT